MRLPEEVRVAVSSLVGYVNSIDVITSSGIHGQGKFAFVGIKTKSGVSVIDAVVFKTPETTMPVANLKNLVDIIGV